MFNLEYKKVYGVEGVFGGHKLGIEINVSCDHDGQFSEVERHAFYRVTGELTQVILRESERIRTLTNPGSCIGERLALLECFGTSCLYVEEIPNGYCSDWCCSQKPWFVVTTPKGRITIGWRKRVINIDWAGSKITVDGKNLPDTGVTYGATYKHAYGYDKAKEYLDLLLGH